MSAPQVDGPPTGTLPSPRGRCDCPAMTPDVVNDYSAGGACGMFWFFSLSLDCVRFGQALGCGSFGLCSSSRCEDLVGAVDHR